MEEIGQFDDDSIDDDIPREIHPEDRSIADDTLTMPSLRGTASVAETLSIAPRLRAKEENEEEVIVETPWWMNFMEEEGLFDDDTSTVFTGNMEEEMFPEAKEESGSASAENENEKLVRMMEDDDSFVGEHEDWRERLWTVATNHWNYQDDKSDIDLLTSDQNPDNHKVMEFRNKLLICIDAYLSIFGDITPLTTEKVSTLRSEATEMSPFVPLEVARQLFFHVLKNMTPYNREGTQGEDGEKGQEEKEEEEPIETESAFVQKAEYITRVLLSPETDIFRTYMVEPTNVEEPENNDPKIERETRNLLKKEGKRVRTERIHDDRRRQRDVELLIYGEMYHSGEEKKSDEPEKIPEEKDVVAHSDGPEEEVRIRSGISVVVRSIVESDRLPDLHRDWTLGFVEDVLLNSLLRGSLTNDRLSVVNFLTSRVDRTTETSLAYMYAIRYFPHYYVRSWWHSSQDSSYINSDSFHHLMQYFGDTRLIRNRLVVLGIYNGIMVHVQELEALFDELTSSGVEYDEAQWENFFRTVHRSIADCLTTVLQENMRSANFLPSKTTNGIDWKITDITDNPNFQIEKDHPQVVSICLEIGRSFHFQGVALGKREQARVSREAEESGVLFHKRNFDDLMTELEVAAYLEAQSAYQGALNVLQRAEGAIRVSQRLSELESGDLADLNSALEQGKLQAVKHITEARVTIELYLSDTLTTLAYCYEAKQSEFNRALKCYNESLALYTRHVGKDHPTVIHGLQSVGCIHLELAQWKEAAMCFVECLDLMRGRLPPPIGNQNRNAPVVFQLHEENVEMVSALKNLGCARLKLGEYDAAFDCFSKAVDQMSVSIVNNQTRDPRPKKFASGEPPPDPIVCDAMSKMVDVLFAKMASVKRVYTKRRLAILYLDDETSDLNTLDGLRLSRLQIERRGVEIARDVVKMRKTLLFRKEENMESSATALKTGEIFESRESDGGNTESVQWHQMLNFAADLRKLGKLYFRRRDYDDAIDSWTEGLSLLENEARSHSFDSMERKASRALQAALAEWNEQRVDVLSELAYLLGVASCRINRNDKATTFFEKALRFLDEKRKLFTDRDSKSKQVKPLDESWDILDLDVGQLEHALGLAYFYSKQYTPATSHYREALRLFEAVAARRKARQSLPKQSNENNESEIDDPMSHHEQQPMANGTTKTDSKKIELDVAINNAIAAVMLSLGGVYHEQQKVDRARRFLEGSIQIVYSTTHRILSLPKDATDSIPSITSFSNVSLVVSVIRVGDAHRRIALINMERRNQEEAKLAFETAMRYLESTNLESRISLAVDDEAHLESIGQAEVHEMLMICYEQMVSLFNKAREEAARGQRGASWFGFGGQANEDELEEIDGFDGLTREDLLFRLANIHANRSQFDSAIRCFLESKNLTEKRLGTNEHPIVGNILFNLGNVYKNICVAQADKLEQKAKERAIETFIESLRITKLTAGSDSLAAAEVMEALASILMLDDSRRSEEKSYDDDNGAVNFLRDAVAIRKKHRSEMSLPFAQSMHFLGMVRLRQVLSREVDDEEFRDERGIDESISCLSQALRIRRILLGDHPDVAASANHLGVAIWKRSGTANGNRIIMIKDSMKQLSDALFIRRMFLDRRNASEISTGSTGGASRSLRRDLDGVKDIGAMIISTVENMYDLSQTHESIKNFEAQRACLNDALAILEGMNQKMLDTDDWRENRLTISSVDKNIWRARIYHALGTSWFESGTFRNAASDFELSLRYRGLDSIETATSDEVFDNFFRQQPGTPPRKDKGLIPLETAVTMEKLAVSYDELSRREDALRCYSFCLRVYGERYGTDSLKVAAILRRVGKVYQDRHDYKRCVRALQRALHIRDSIERDDYTPRVDDALVFMQLARSLMALGAYDEVALEHFHSAVGILEDVNHISQTELSKRKIVLPSRREPHQKAADGHNSHELLLEGYSSILVLLRRHRDESAESDQRISDCLHHIGNAQAALGQYDKALKSLGHVLQFKKMVEGNEHLSVADLLFNLGNIYVETSQVDKARECHHECHRISAQILGNDSIELAENMICLGNVEFLAGNYPLALEWFDEALRLLRKNPEYEVAVSKCLHRKAVAHDKLGEYERAIEYFTEVLRLDRKIYGPNHIELSNVLNSMGNVHRNRAEIKRALKCYEECLRIRLRSGDELCIANIKNNIGAIFTSMGQVDRARQFYAESLRIKTSALGSTNMETARTLYNLGQLYIAEKTYEKGLKFFFESLRIFKVQFGESHNEVASCLCSIGTVYDEMQDEETALSYFKQSLNSVKGLPGAKGVRASALHNVGIILTKRNDIDHAVRIFRESLELKSSDHECEDMSDTQYCLANVLRLTGCANEALDLHKAALDTRLHYLGPDHVDVADSMFGLAQALIDNGNHREALNLLHECTRIRRSSYGEADDKVADATFLLGIVLREVGNLSESLVCLKKALEAKERSCGDDGVEIADISFKIAIVLCEMGKYDEAKGYNNKSLQIRNRIGGENSNEVATTLENMGIIDQKLGDHGLAIERMKRALDMKRETAGENDHDVGVIIHAMAVSFTELQKYDNAIRLFEDAVKRKKICHGPKHLEVARALVDEGKVFEQVGEYERALMCYEEAIDSDCYEDNSWEIGRVFMRMGITHYALGKSEDAWDCLSEATRIFEYVERTEKRMGIYNESSKLRSKRDLHDLIKCYECMLRLSEASPTRYNIDRSLVLPKVAQVLSEIKEFRKAAILYKDAIILLKSLPGDTRFVVATNLHNLGNCLHHLGEFNEALTCLEDALGLLQDIPGVEGKHIADTYHSLAFVHHTRSDMQESLTCYSNALKCRRGDPSADKAGIVSTLVNMGEVLRILGMYDSSIKSCKDALRLIESKGGSKQLIIASIVECIGSTHRDRYEYEKALRCFKECLKQRQEAVGNNDFLVAKTLHSLCLLYVLRNEKERAKDCALEALSVLKRQMDLPDRFGNPEVADQNEACALISDAIQQFIETRKISNVLEEIEIVVTLASLMEQQGRYDESLVCNEAAVNLLEGKLSTDHLLMALVKHRIGTIYFKKGSFDEAVPKLREALHIRRGKLGDNHIDTEETLKVLARAYAATGDSEMALFYFKEIMSIRKERTSMKVDAVSESDLLLRLGRLHLEQHEFADSLQCFKDSLQLQRQVGLGRDDQKLGETLQSMGSALLEMKQHQEARLTLLSAMKILERGRHDSAEMMNTTFLMGRVNEAEANYDKALAWFDRSMSILNDVASGDKKMRARITFRVGMVTFGLKKFEQALSRVEEAQDLFISEFGPHHHEYATCLHSKGKIQLALKEFTSAKECFQSALEGRQAHLKQNDPNLGESFHCVGSCLAEVESPDDAHSYLTEALRIRMLNFGEDSYEVGETRRILGDVELKLGQVGPALEHLQEAIRIGMAIVQLKRECSDEEYENLMLCFDSVIGMAKNGRYPERLGKLFHQKGSLQSLHKMYKPALNSFTEAIQVYKSTHGEDHLNVANALFNVGICLRETGDTDRAMKCFARALNISRAQLGEDHSEVADTLQQMAEVYRMKGDIRGAVKWCEQALEIRRETEDAALASLLDFAGELYTRCDDADESERYFRECIRIRKKIFGDEHIGVATSLFSLGFAYESIRRDNRRALRCYEESIRIRKNIMEDEDIETARCYLHLGTVHSSLQNEKKASFCFSHAIHLCTELNDPSHVIVEDAIIGQGSAFMAQEQYEEALEQYQKARNMRKIRSEGGKEESKETADIRVLEATVLEKLGRQHEALSGLVSALDMYKVTVGMEHLGTSGALHRLAELHFAMNEQEEALESAQQALKIRKSRLGKHDELTGDSYFIIGKIFFVRKDLDTARPCLEAALEIFRHKRGGAHYSVADSMFYLGCIHGQKKEYDEAIEHFQGALRGRQQNFGRDHLLVSDVLFRLGIIHKKRDEFELGSDCLSECLRIRTETKGKDHTIVADTLFELAGTLKDSNQVSGKLEPSQCYVDAIRIYRQSLGESHVKVAKCLARLADILISKGDKKKATSCYEKSVAIFESKLDRNPDPDTVSDFEEDYEAYADALLDWATFLDNTGNDGSAMKTYRRALVLLQAFRGRDDDVIDNTLCKIANVLGRQDRFGEALQLLDQVRKRRIASVGENHPLVADVFFALSQLYDRKRDYHSAMSALENCIRIRRATMGPFSEEVAEVLVHIGHVQSNRADFKSALQSWDEALALYQKAGIPADDEAVVTVKKHKERANAMLESLEGI